MIVTIVITHFKKKVRGEDASRREKKNNNNMFNDQNGFAFCQQENQIHGGGKWLQRLINK